jgi:hypothetical protein
VVQPEEGNEEQQQAATPPDDGFPAPISSEPVAAPDHPASVTIEQLQPYVYWWYFERTYRLIFGTQIRMLHFLNEQPLGADRLGIIPFFEAHLALYTAHGLTRHRMSYKSYMAFLHDSNLVTIDAVDTYHITPLGRAFRQWMSAENVSSDRLL